MIETGEITASYSELERQAVDAAEHYLHRAVIAIDGQFEDGFAEANPGLVAAFIRCCATEFAAATQGKVLCYVANVLSETISEWQNVEVAKSLDQIAEAIKEVGEVLDNQESISGSLDSIADSLDSVAEAITQSKPDKE
jgi:hypothetical protein